MTHIKQFILLSCLSLMFGCKSLNSRLANESEVYRSEDRALFDLLGKGYRSGLGQFVSNDCFIVKNVNEFDSVLQETRKISFIENAESAFEENVFGGLVTLSKAYLYREGGTESTEISDRNLALRLFDSPLSQLEFTILSSKTKNTKEKQASVIELSDRGKQVANSIFQNPVSWFYHECGNLVISGETLGAKSFEMYNLSKGQDQSLNNTLSQKFRKFNGRNKSYEAILKTEEDTIRTAECHAIHKNRSLWVDMLDLTTLKKTDWGVSKGLDKEGNCTGKSVFSDWLTHLDAEIGIAEKSLPTTVRTVSLKADSIVNVHLNNSYKSGQEVTPDRIAAFLQPNSLQENLLNTNKSNIYAKIDRRAALRTVVNAGQQIIKANPENDAAKSLFAEAKHELVELNKYFDRVFKRIVACADKPSPDSCTLKEIEDPVQLVNEYEMTQIEHYINE